MNILSLKYAVSSYIKAVSVKSSAYARQKKTLLLLLFSA